MEPLMNAPQWFLERKDSVELVQGMSMSDPIGSLMAIQGNSVERYILFSKGKSGVFFWGIRNIEEVEYLMRTILEKGDNPIFLYDKKEDTYKKITLCMVVNRNE